MLPDLVEQRERLARAHAVFSRVHAHMTARGEIGELDHGLDPDWQPHTTTDDPWRYTERHDTELRGWAMLSLKIEPLNANALGEIHYKVEVILSSEDLGAESSQWEGSSLAVLWTEKAGWRTEHFPHNEEPSIEAIIEEFPNDIALTEAEAFACIDRFVTLYRRIRSATPDWPDAQA